MLLSRVASASPLSPEHQHLTEWCACGAREDLQQLLESQNQPETVLQELGIIRTVLFSSCLINTADVKVCQVPLKKIFWKLTLRIFFYEQSSLGK